MNENENYIPIPDYLIIWIQEWLDNPSTREMHWTYEEGERLLRGIWVSDDYVKFSSVKLKVPAWKQRYWLN